MNPLIKAGIGVGALAGASGVGYGIYSNMKIAPKAPEKTTTYAEALNGTLLDTTNNNHRANWEARLTTIKALPEDTSLVDELKTIKSKQSPEATWEDLKSWCSKKIGNPNKEGQELENIKNYCTFSIKEKIENAIGEDVAEGDNKWEKAHEALKGITNEEQLDNTLKGIKQKTGEEAKREVRNWCIGKYKIPFKGQENQDYKNASIICISKN